MADGRPSVTHYATLEAHRFASLLEVHLETGRTHQIRVHMAALKHPCVGDLTYGADPALAKRVGLERQWLHAVRLGFEHPDSGEYVEYESTYPDDLAQRARSHPRCRLTPVAPAGGRAATPTPMADVHLAARARGARCRRASTPTTRSRAWLAGRLRSDDEVWVAEVRRARSAATPGSPTTWLDDLYVAPGAGRPGHRLGAARPGQGAPPGRVLPVGLRDATRRPAASTPGTAWSSWSAPTAPATRSAPRTSGWPGPGPTRSASTGASSTTSTTSSATCSPAGPRSPARSRTHKHDRTRDPVREREIAEPAGAPTRPRLGEDRLARIVHAIITESLDALDD